MSRERKFRTLVGDFETTVYEGQSHTEVWASALVEIGTEDVLIFHSIEETFKHIVSMKENVVVYYHNLKFDGSFWLAYLMVELGMKQAYHSTGTGDYELSFEKDKDMPDNSFKYMISDMGFWYTITIKKNNRLIVLKDSLKLLPFSVAEIGKAFKTKHRKLEMEYKGFRYAGCEITDKEKEYIANDVLVVKEALEIMFKQGHSKLTIGSCCLEEYKRTLGGNDVFTNMFPNMYEIYLQEDRHGAPNVGEWVRKSYRGGWCYVVKEKTNIKYHNGITADVNSLYPSVMHSESGNYYPVGTPTFWTGNYIPEEAKMKHRYFFIRIKTRFYLKPNKLPFIQIKKSLLYKPTEMLETSDVYNPKTGKYLKQVYNKLEDRWEDTTVELTMTMTDYRLFLEHYYVKDFEIIDGCWFNSSIGLFDDYINVYKEQKINSTGALRTLAKLFLNNLYGKMATSTDSSFKFAQLNEDLSLGFVDIIEHDKKPGYIPIGSAITSYARNFTIRTAQANYYGKNKAGFIYADTDSIHCDLPADKLKGIKVHPTNFCCWKLESSWDEAIFVRQKTYMEHVVAEDLQPIETPYWSIKCAGMPDRCKKLFQYSMDNLVPIMRETDEGLVPIKYSTDEKIFLGEHRTIDDFKVGLKVPGKLLPKRVRGGIILQETTYELRR